jgi:hypothetical protein
MDMYLLILPDYEILVFGIKYVAFIYFRDVEVTIDGVCIGEWIY